jgi:hypothetical protein
MTEAAGACSGACWFPTFVQSWQVPVWCLF